jgi:hypothetical protein
MKREKGLHSIFPKTAPDLATTFQQLHNLVPHNTLENALSLCKKEAQTCLLKKTNNFRKINKKALRFF